MSGTTFTKLPVMIVALVIGLILTFTAVMPLVSDYAEAKTFKNDGSFELTYIQTEDLNLVWNYETPTKITINSESVDLPTLTNGNSRTILCGSEWIVRLGYGDTLGGYYVQYYPSSGSNVLASEGNQTNFSATGSNGTVSITNGTNTASASYTYLYCIAKEGNFVMKNANDSVYMKGDSEFYAMGLTNVGTITSVGIKVTGTIDDGANWSIFRGNAEQFTFSDQEINSEKVSGYIDLYKLTSMTATVTNGDQSINAVYSYFIVPAEVTADPDNPTAYKNLVSVIPLFALILLVAAAATLVYFKNKD